MTTPTDDGTAPGTAATAPSAGSSSPRRSVEIERTGPSTYTARNERGGELRVSAAGDAGFTPVELLLVALGTCSAVDLEVAVRRAEPEVFAVRVDAEKVRVEGASALRDIEVTFDVRFPAGSDGDAARTVLPRALQVSHDRSCTVSRTVEAGTPVTMRLLEG